MQLGKTELQCSENRKPTHEAVICRVPLEPACPAGRENSHPAGHAPWSLTQTLPTHGTQGSAAQCHVHGRITGTTETPTWVTVPQGECAQPAQGRRQPPQPNKCNYLPGQSPCSAHPCCLKSGAVPRCHGPPVPVGGNEISPHLPWLLRASAGTHSCSWVAQRAGGRDAE